MSKIAWATDIHLDHISQKEAPYQNWVESIKSSQCESLLLTGDIATAPTLDDWLQRVSVDIQIPIYFVLGNHDYYHGSINEVRTALGLSKHPNLHWLGKGEVTRLSDSTSLVGHGGWGDTRVGDFFTTNIRVNDHRLIEELSNIERTHLKRKLLSLGTEAAENIKNALKSASTQINIIATHVPPFRSSTWYNGRYGDIEWMPDFCCGAVGEMLLEHAKENPEQQFIVYCGHTHGEGRHMPLPNLQVFTGKAEYGQPSLQGVISVNTGIIQDEHRYSVSR